MNGLYIISENTTARKPRLFLADCSHGKNVTSGSKDERQSGEVAEMAAGGCRPFPGADDLRKFRYARSGAGY